MRGREYQRVDLVGNLVTVDQSPTTYLGQVRRTCYPPM